MSGLEALTDTRTAVGVETSQTSVTVRTTRTVASVRHVTLT